MEAHPDQGFVRLALPLLMAWAGMKLTSAQRSVLDCLAIECWGFGRKGYQCNLTGAEIARRTGITKRGANKALSELHDAGVINRDGRDIEIQRTVPDAERPRVQAWYRRMRGTDVPDRVDVPDDAGTDSPQRGTTVPDAHKGTRAEIDKTLSSSKTNRATKPKPRNDDDDQQKQVLKGLAHSLAGMVSSSTGQSEAEVLAQLRTLQAGSWSALSLAMAQILVAIDNRQVKPASVRQLVAHALNNPESYPAVNPAVVLTAVMVRDKAKAEQQARQRSVDDALAAVMRQQANERLKKSEIQG